MMKKYLNNKSQSTKNLTRKQPFAYYEGGINNEIIQEENSFEEQTARGEQPQDKNKNKIIEDEFDEV